MLENSFPFPSEPRSCPFPKDANGLCSYHRRRFELRMSEEMGLASMRLAATVLGLRAAPRQVRIDNGRSGN